MSAPDAFTNRSKKLAGIVRYYDSFYSELQGRGCEPYQMTRLGAWATSRAPHVFYFFKSIDLSSYRLFIDLGSGDGIVSCIAGLFTRSIGIEIDQCLCVAAKKASRDLQLDATVDFICGDYRDHRIERSDCVYLYPDKPIDHLERKLPAWKGTALVYGPHLPPEARGPARTLRCGKERIALYRGFAGKESKTEASG